MTQRPEASWEKRSAKHISSAFAVICILVGVEKQSNWMCKKVPQSAIIFPNFNCQDTVLYKLCPEYRVLNLLYPLI
jgi:hypothetical protein